MPFYVKIASGHAQHRYVSLSHPFTDGDGIWEQPDDGDGGFFAYPTWQLVLHYAPTCAVRMDVVRRDLAPLIAAGGQLEGSADMRHERWHQANLPAGWSWYGTYAVVNGNGRGGGFQITSPQRWTCPHCAFIAMDNEGLSGSLAWYPPSVTEEQFVYSIRGPLPLPEIVGAPVPPNHETTKLTDWTAAASCGNCGRIGHRAPTCENPPKTHRMVGIEIEGFWDDIRAAQNRASDIGMSRGTSDGSVNGIYGSNSWEFQTTPGSLGQALNQLHTMYPDRTNRSAGMHVHVSWNDATDASLLHTPEFFAYFKRRWTEWGTHNEITPGSYFWQRLNGNNSFCRINQADGVHSDITQMDRYAQLNFSAWREFQTVECRLLPMFYNETLAISAVQELISIYEDFLVAPEQFMQMPKADCRVDKPSALSSKASTSIETRAPRQDKVVYEVMVNALKPPAPGMVRMVVAGGEFDMMSLIKAAKATNDKKNHQKLEKEAATVKRRGASKLKVKAA